MGIKTEGKFYLGTCFNDDEEKDAKAEEVFGRCQKTILPPLKINRTNPSPVITFLKLPFFETCYFAKGKATIYRLPCLGAFAVMSKGNEKERVWV